MVSTSSTQASVNDCNRVLPQLVDSLMFSSLVPIHQEKLAIALLFWQRLCLGNIARLR